MTKTKMLAATTALGLIAASGAAYAQTTPPAAAPAAQGSTAPASGGAAVGGPAQIAQGGTIYDTSGGTVGTIESVQGDFVVVATGKNKVKLPKSSFAQGEKGPTMAMTAAQLDQAASAAAPQQAAQAAPAKAEVTKGAQVADTQGGSVGTVAEVDAQFATVELSTGGKVRLPKTAFGAGPNGGLRVAMTAQQLGAAASAAGGGDTKGSGTSS